MNEKYVDPSPFAFGAFAFTWWMYCMIQAGWAGAANLGVAIALAFAAAGTGILICSVLEFFRGDAARCLLFLFFGTGWWTWAIWAKWFQGDYSKGFMGFWWLGWGLLTFFFWLFMSKKNLWLQLFLLGLWITFVLWAIATWWVPALNMVGGYVGLVTALAGFILFLTELKAAIGEASQSSAGGMAT